MEDKYNQIPIKTSFLFRQSSNHQRKLLSVYNKKYPHAESERNEISYTVKKSLFNSNNKHLIENTNSDNYKSRIAFEYLDKSWIDLVLPITILGIGVILFISVILFIWIKNYFSESRAVKANKNLFSNKNSRDLILKEMSNTNVKSKIKVIEKQMIQDNLSKCEKIEQKIKNSPPLTPKSQIDSDFDGSEIDEEAIREKNSIDNSKKQICEMTDPETLSTFCGKHPRASSPIIIVPVPVPVPIPLFADNESSSSQISTMSVTLQQPNCSENVQQHDLISNSSLKLLQGEVCCIQPPQAKEESCNKYFKNSGTSPPPFSPYVSHIQPSAHKYATRGTQTFFTKSPNSPNNWISTTSITLTSVSSENKENKEPLRNVCLNKSVNHFKSDNMENFSSYSPGNISPKITNILQQQNSPVLQADSPKQQASPISRFSFSPKIVCSTNSPTPTVSSANYKHGNYFKFPDVDTPPSVTVSISDTTSKQSRGDLSKPSLTPQASFDFSNISQNENSLTESITQMRELSIDSDKDNPREIIILRIDEIDDSEDCRDMNSTEVYSYKNQNIKNNNNYNNNNSENTLTIRRNRLKSISLDSDGAKLVEENLGIPVEELVELTSYNNKEIADSPADNEVSINNQKNNNNPKNIYNLTLNLDFRDSSLLDLNDNDINSNSEQPNSMFQNTESDYEDVDDEDKFNSSKTPTMKYFRHKAVSLDSSNASDQVMKISTTTANMKTASETFNYYFGCGNKTNNSISVPSTPKHLTSTKLKLSTSEEPDENRKAHTTFKCGNLKKVDSSEKSTLMPTTTLSTNIYKSNLTTSTTTLNVSTSNLKTLPEVASITDFDKERKGSIPRSIPTASAKSGLLQRRGSNHSLTLNIDGSIGNLSRGLSCSNYSLGNLQGSHLNIAGSNYNLNNAPLSHCRNITYGGNNSTVKKNLLQRRGSNTSLTLNIQGSNNSLNRFNSHSSLNINASNKKNLLERRNSNASLTLNIQNRGLSISNCNLRGSECSLSSVNTNQINDLMTENEAEQEDESINKSNCASFQYGAHQHQRKFHSSENLHNLSIHSKYNNPMHNNNSNRHHKQQPSYGSIDNLKHSNDQEESHEMHTQSHNEKSVVRNITTKPLSPHSTSEDFKIYLANIQYLQNASNILSEQQLKNLNHLFQKSYCTHTKVETIAHHDRQFNNDDILNSRAGDGNTITIDPDEEKKLLIKLHQEFWDLPTNYQEKPLVFGSQSKNRYKSILPNEHSRVILLKESPELQFEPYINANYIKVTDFYKFFSALIKNIKF